MRLTLIILFALLHSLVAAQFAPPAGQPGTTAIHKDSSCFVAWASNCLVHRGWQNIADTALGKTSVGDSSMACGMAGINGVVSLGDGGQAIINFNYPLRNGPGWDFAVFENSFTDTFLELAFVEASSDGVNFYRFPAVSLTDTASQVGPFDVLDATKINNLAGKYRVNYGTPFDLEELSLFSGLNTDQVTHIRIIDVIGSIDKQYATYDNLMGKINDPWPTPFPSGGFDLDAVGVIHQNTSSLGENHFLGNLRVFPNPVSDDYINVQLDSDAGVIYILDTKGGICKEFPVNKNSVINIAELLPGIYFLKYISSKSISTAKLIKSK